jgi:hypothetical protein
MRPAPLALTLIRRCGGLAPLLRVSRRLSQTRRCQHPNAPRCLESSAASRCRSYRFHCRSAVCLINPPSPAMAICLVFWRAWRPGADRLRRHSQVPPEYRCELWAASSTNRKLPHLTRPHRSLRPRIQISRAVSSEGSLLWLASIRKIRHGLRRRHSMTRCAVSIAMTRCSRGLFKGSAKSNSTQAIGWWSVPCVGATSVVAKKVLAPSGKSPA